MQEVNLSPIAVVRLPRPIALATWQNLQYALLRYYKDQPGLHFGVVLLSSCKKKWLEKVVVGSYVTSKSAHLNVEGIVQVIGPYGKMECMEKFSICSTDLFASNDPIDLVEKRKYCELKRKGTVSDKDESDPSDWMERNRKKIRSIFN